ncbi:ADP-ribosylglycohydrolase family protein [Agromyces sp. NPDC058484]|uniref:ADP-ribosylglycohydrolase family protein n=1 Tax=Agromyces sp. NPDC058484 TaxID=3346524 RepID=UPI00364DF236
MNPLRLTPVQLDRAAGAVLGSAAGDALGAPYEFRPSVPDDVAIVMKAGGPWELGEWTDDTSMAIPILRALARGASLDDETGASNNLSSSSATRSTRSAGSR